MLFLVLVVLGPGMTVEAKPSANSGGPSGRAEILLSDADWKLGSFPMGVGEERKAYEIGFDERGFKSVPVPAEIQLTLGLEGMDLFRQSKELSLINKSEWWYRKRFTVPPEQAGQIVRLVFEGSDYFTTVWLNGEKLGEHEGAYMSFSFDITSRVKPGRENVLTVKVTCPWLLKDRGLEEYMKGSFGLTWLGMSTTFSRLPHALSFSWNGIPAWGNAAFTVGLIRDVKLVITPPQNIEDVFVYTKSLNRDGSATLAISGTLRNDGTTEVRRTLDLALRPLNFTGKVQRLPKQTLSLHPGANAFSVEATIRDPQLWWSWDLGPQNLYQLVTNLSESPAKSGDLRETTFGIRTISRQADLSYWLNGKHLFTKGAWYPAGDYYSSRNTRSSYETDLLLLRAANANFIVNHTVMEKASFYELCDELGIMVFIQMPFQQAGPFWTMEPSSPRREAFLKMAFEQARQMVRELRNHPSIVAWAPYAESQWSEWAKYYGPLYEGMRQVVTELDPGATFHPSYCDFGEEHIWRAAAGFPEKIGIYQDHYDFQPAFVSEYGSCAMSSYENLHKWLSTDEIWSDKNPRRPEWFYLPIDLQAHEYLSSLGMDWGLHSLLSFANKWVDRDCRSANELVEASQLYQAFLLRYSSDAQRRKKYNPIQGSRWWAYKDIAPGYGWGFLDFDQVPKMAYYAFKRSMAPLAVSFAIRDELEPQVAGQILHIPVWVVNDHRFEVPLDVRCEVLDLTGRKIATQSLQTTVGPDESKTVDVLNWTVPNVSGVSVFALRATAQQRGGTLAAMSTIYLKVVPSPYAPILEGVPKLGKKCRLLLIGTKNYWENAEPIASNLRGLGVEVDEINEEHLERFGELRQAEALRRNYDVIWLGPFEALWKVLDEDMAEGLAQAVREGVSFIHTGGTSSFHGGESYGARLDFTKLAEVLPVKVREGRDELNQRNASKDVRVFAPGWTDAGLKEVGIEGFNEVETKEGSQVIMKFEDWPLLVAGHYGKGRTVAFMGYTPVENKVTPTWLSLYGQMLLAALGENPEYRYAAVTASDKPIPQLLKEQPQVGVQASPATLEATIKGNAGSFAVEIANGERFARLVRLRMEWEDPARQPHVVMYDDNYFDLFPGEKRRVPVEFRTPQAFSGTVKGTLIIAGTNVPEIRVPVSLVEGR